MCSRASLDPMRRGLERGSWAGRTGWGVGERGMEQMVGRGKRGRVVEGKH